MFFQDAPPDTSAYMIGGYTLFFVITAIYLISLFARSRNLALDLATLQSMEAEARASTTPAAPIRPRVKKQATARPKHPKPKQVVKKVKAKK